MAKTFITERDVEDLFRQGTMTITITDDMVLTDLAYEKAQRLEMKMVQTEENPPAAPIRPYLNAPTKKAAPTVTSSAPRSTTGSGRVTQIKNTVRAKVKERLGANVDMSMVDAVIDKVAKDLGLG